MIITIIFVVLMALGIIFDKLFWEKDILSDDTLCTALLVIGIAGSSVCAGMIWLSHCGVDIKIQRNNIQYEALIQRYEIVNSKYEDVSKSDVIRDIGSWNEQVVANKYWAYNPWTNWFYSKKVVDNLKAIEYKR